MGKVIYPELSYQVQGAFFDVHNALRSLVLQPQVVRIAYRVAHHGPRDKQNGLQLRIHRWPNERYRRRFGPNAVVVLGISPQRRQPAAVVVVLVQGEIPRLHCVPTRDDSQMNDR